MIRRYSLCLNIDGFMRNNKFPDGWDIFEDDDGKPLSPVGALAHLATEKAKGRKVIPCSAKCGAPCSQAEKGCEGFDYAGGGCPGYEIPE